MNWKIKKINKFNNNIKRERILVSSFIKDVDGKVILCKDIEKIKIVDNAIVAFIKNSKKEYDLDSGVNLESKLKYWINLVEKKLEWEK